MINSVGQGILPLYIGWVKEIAGIDTVHYTVTSALCGAAVATKAIVVLPLSVCTEGVSGVGVTAKSTLEVYPNPNEGLFTMKLSANVNEAVHVRLVSILGAQVKEFDTITNKLTGVKLDVAPGIYILHADTKDGTYTAKVTVE